MICPHGTKAGEEERRWHLTFSFSFSHRGEKKVWKPQCRGDGCCPLSHRKVVVTGFLSIAESSEVCGDPDTSKRLILRVLETKLWVVSPQQCLKNYPSIEKRKYGYFLFFCGFWLRSNVKVRVLGVVLEIRTPVSLVSASVDTLQLCSCWASEAWYFSYLMSPRRPQSPENDVMLQWAEWDAYVLVVERIKRRWPASWVSQEGSHVGLAVTSAMCALKVGLSPLHQWNERLLLPLLFHWLELFSQGFHVGHHSLLWSPQMQAGYVVSMLVWFIDFTPYGRAVGSP